MAMRTVSRDGVVAMLTMLLALASAPAGAQSTNGGREINVSVLGSSNRFSQPVRTVDDLRAMANANRNQLTHVMMMAGLANISTQVLDTLIAGHVTETTIAPGSHFYWMAMKRAGRPVVLQNVRWTGRQPFEAWQFAVRANGTTYGFVVPKVCGNLSLLTVAASSPVITRAPEPRTPLPPPPPPAVVAITPTPPPAHVATTTHEASYRPWVASGFIGTSFDTSTNLVSEDDVTNSVAFGGQISYMWWDKVGGEFLASFAPSVGIANAFLADTPHVNTYMGNVIGSVPFGRNRQFRPYISAGLGAIAMRTTVFASVKGIDTISANDSRFGSNIGGGLMVFGGRVGVRADMRHYSATTSTDAVLFKGESPSDLTSALLSGLSFWRTDVGVAFRW
jgi:outer membrane protein W